MGGPGAHDVVVVGAGVVGCSIALDLARGGRRPLVVDKGPAPGAGSTSASSAIVRFNYSTRDGVAAAWEAAHVWQAWEEHLGRAPEGGLARFHRTGMLVVDPPATTRPHVTGLLDEVGVPWEALSRDDLAQRFPAIDPGRYWPPRAVAEEAFWDAPDGDASWWYMPDAGFVDDPRLAAANLAAAARAAGATFEMGVRVVGVRSSGGRVLGVTFADGRRADAPVVVNAAGPWSSALNRLAGVLDDFAVSTRPLRQEVHAVPAPAGFAIGDGGAVVADPDLGTYFRPQPGGTLLVGGLEPECDPLVWLDDPDAVDPNPTVEVWQAQVYRAARRLPGLAVPNRPVGLAGVYDVTPDWIPIYDRTSLGGYYVAIGTSGNQFKNAPVIGRFMAALIEACEAGHDHDRAPVRVECPRTAGSVDLGHYSRLRPVRATTFSVLG